MPNSLMPRQPVPPLEVHPLAGAPWRLAEQRPARFTLIVVYRGFHCPLCRGYLAGLAKQVEELATLGVAVIAISSDSAARAEAAHAAWGLGNLPIGYGLELETARRWGLYVSSGRGATPAGVDEPERFVEPGLFLVRPDGTLYFASVQTMPFLRPDLTGLLKALDFIIKHDYPARGEAAV